MDAYTVSKRFIVTTESMKSKFIAILSPLENEDAFKEQLKNITILYPKAKHYVYAYRVGEKSKSCDDREPKGTAGRPILEVLHKKNLNNVALVVVRYFGGTKLGSGKLLRTYVASASSVIAASEIVPLERK